MATKLLLVGDQPVVFAGLRALLAGASIDVIGEADSPTTAGQLGRDLRPDVVLVAGAGDPVPWLAGLRDAGHAGAAVVFGGSLDPSTATRMDSLGVSCLLGPRSGRGELLDAIGRAAWGEGGWPPGEPPPPLAGAASSQSNGPLPALTRRESEVLEQLALGLTNKEIAQALGISYETVKEHVQHVLRKIGVTDRTQAAVWAVRRGLA